MQLISYNGVSFASLGLSPGFLDENQSGPEMASVLVDRQGYDPIHLGVSRGPRTWRVSFAVLGPNPLEATQHSLLGLLDAYNDDERLLVGTLQDGTAVQLYAAIGSYEWNYPEEVTITFSASNSIWRKPTPTTYGPASWSETAPLVLPVPNNGKARANLQLILKPTAVGGSPDFTTRRTFTVTNNGDSILRRFPFEISLGSTVGLGSTNEKRTWLFLNGLVQPREILGWRETVSYMWILLDQLGPGDTVTYDLAYSAGSDTSGLTGQNRIAFDIGWEKRTVTAGAASTVTVGGGAMRVNQWRRGRIDVLSGLGAGQQRSIASNATNVITLETTWTTIPDATSVLLLTMSHNDRWLWDVFQTSRSNSNRGLWYANRGQTKPSSVSFNNPGTWDPFLYRDNKDEKNQARATPIDVGGGDIDYFTIPDMDRTVQGWSRLQESGQADAVGFSSPFPIATWRSNYAFKNQNGICRGIWGSRESGAEDWEEQWSDGGIYAGLTTSGTLSFTFATDTRHLMIHLAPGNEEELEQSWKRDTGSRTASTTTSITDNTKEWSTGQWVDARCTIVAGKGVGRSRTVTSNTSTTLNVSAAWGVTLDDDTRFEVVNKKLMATLRSHDLWEVGLTNLASHTALSAAISPNYAMMRTLYLDGGPDLVAPYQEIRVGQDGRYIHLAGTEEVRINGTTRRATVNTTASGAMVKDVSSAVVFKAKDVSGITTLATDALLVQPKLEDAITNPDFATSITGWIFNTATAGVTNAVTWDGTLGHLANGSMKMDMTASTAGAGAVVIWYANSQYNFISPGQPATVTAWARASTPANWQARIWLAWYTSAGAFVAWGQATATIDTYLTLANTWTQIGFNVMPPATAVKYAVALVGYQKTASSIGTVWFDEVRANTTALFMPLNASSGVATVTATLAEGFHS